MGATTTTAWTRWATSCAQPRRQDLQGVRLAPVDADVAEAEGAGETVGAGVGVGVGEARDACCL